MKGVNSSIAAAVDVAGIVAERDRPLTTPAP